MSAAQDREIRTQLERLEALIQDTERLPDEDARAHARALVQALMDFHGAAIARLLERIAETGEAGGDQIESLASDELISSLLLLYGLHPLDVETRVQNALERVRPYLKSHGGNVELIGVSEGAVCAADAGKLPRLSQLGDDAQARHRGGDLRGGADVARIEVEGVVAPPPGGLIEIKPLPAPRRSPRSGRLCQRRLGGSRGPRHAARGDRPPARSLGPTGPGRPGRGRTYAYGPTCPGCGADLSERSLDETELVCGGCDRRFDVLHAGRELEDSILHLDPFPLLVESGRVRIAVPA